MAKDTHKFLEGNHTLEWVTLIWKICIPPSTSFMMWRLIHNKISLDDNMHTKREASWLRWVVYTILKGKQHPTSFFIITFPHNFPKISEFRSKILFKNLYLL